MIKLLITATFYRKQNNQTDFSLNAEEVAGIVLLSVTRHDRGELEGIKYDRIGVVLINAAGEQQQIEARQKEFNEQRELIRKQEKQLETRKK